MSDSGGPPRGTIARRYDQRSVKRRLEAAFLDNVGRVLTRAQLQEVARDPVTGQEPENWHQRLSELRTDDGYTILSQRDGRGLGVGEYLLASVSKREVVNKRVRPTPATWKRVLDRANDTCEWREGSQVCELRSGDVDPVGGGTVKLTPDHKRPHALASVADPENEEEWQALCGRHQVMKKNYWDNLTGKLNVSAIVQAAPVAEKRDVYEFLKRYFGDAT